MGAWKPPRLNRPRIVLRLVTNPFPNSRLRQNHPCPCFLSSAATPAAFCPRILMQRTTAAKEPSIWALARQPVCVPLCLASFSLLSEGQALTPDSVFDDRGRHVEGTRDPARDEADGAFSRFLEVQAAGGGPLHGRAERLR